MEMTLEQKKALALASARVRAQEAQPSASALPKTMSQMPDKVDWALELEKQKAAEMGPGERFFMSMGQPLADIVRSGKKVAANVADYFSPNQKTLSDLVVDRDPSRAAAVQKQIEREKELESPYINPMGRLTGDVMLNMALPTPDSKSRLVRTLAQLGMGAGYGAATSPEDMTGGAAAGTVGTAVGMGVNRVLGGVIKPFVSKDAEALMAQGIQPTPGQAIGGAVNQAEQKLKSLPLVGDIIRGGRNRAVNEFNEKAIQTAVPGVTGMGDEALIAARKALGQQYDDVLSQLPKISMDKNAIMSTATQAAGDASLGLNNASKKYIQDYVGKNLIGRSQDVTGETAKRVESDLLKVITRLRGSADSEQRGIAEALSKVHDAWRSSLAQTAEAVQPGSGKALQEANAAWRAFSALDRAGGYRGNQNVAAGEVAGRFTPNSLRRSIETSDVSQNNNITRALRGGDSPFERLNTLTRQGEKVLGDSVPDSGTATRVMWGLGALGAGTAAGVDPTTAGGAALLALPAYSRAGSKFLMQGATPAYESAVKALTLRGVPMQAVDETLRKYGPQGVISLARSIGLNSAQE